MSELDESVSNNSNDNFVVSAVNMSILSFVLKIFLNFKLELVTELLTRKPSAVIVLINMGLLISATIAIVFK